MKEKAKIAEFCINLQRIYIMSSTKQFLLSFLICLVIFSIIAWNVVGYLEKEIILNSSGEKGSEQPVDSTKTPDNETPPEDTDTPEKIPEVTYFSALVICEDSKSRALDALILVSADLETEKIMASAIPVDTLYAVTGSDSAGERVSYELSLSEAYAMYGVDYLVDRMSALVGIDIEFYAVANSINAKTAINSLGRVQYNIPEDMQYDDIYEPIQLTKGTKQLDGSMAMQLLRYRSYLSGNGDTRRRTTHISFIREFVSQILVSDNKTQLVSKVKNFRNNFITNVSNEDIDKYSDLVFSLSEFEFVNENFPVYATPIDESRVAELHDRFRAYK